MREQLTHYQVVTTRGAKEDLREMHQYLTMRFSRVAASRYLARVRGFASELSYAPLRGRAVEGVRPGMRILGFEHRVTIVFAVFPERRVVEIQGFDFNGRQKRSLESTT